MRMLVTGRPAKFRRREHYPAHCSQLAVVTVLGDDGRHAIWKIDVTIAKLRRVKEPVLANGNRRPGH